VLRVHLLIGKSADQDCSSPATERVRLSRTARCAMEYIHQIDHLLLSYAVAFHHEAHRWVSERLGNPNSWSIPSHMVMTSGHRDQSGWHPISKR
jgi:hypothetical protein